MGEAIVYEDAPREREHLGLVLQPSERRGENEAVEVALEVAADPLLRVVVVFETKSFVAHQLRPRHPCCCVGMCIHFAKLTNIIGKWKNGSIILCEEGGWPRFDFTRRMVSG